MAAVLIWSRVVAGSDAGYSRYIEDAYSGGYLVPFYGVKISNEFILMEEAALQFFKLREAAQKAGYSIKINSAYRSTSEQKRMLRERRQWAARQGHSTHQSGRALDIAGTVARCRPKKKRLCKTRLFKWLEINAPAYGWNNTAPKEPWHWVFSGLDLKTALKGYGRGLQKPLPSQSVCVP